MHTHRRFHPLGLADRRCPVSISWVPNTSVTADLAPIMQYVSPFGVATDGSCFGTRNFLFFFSFFGRVDVPLRQLPVHPDLPLY